MTDGDAPIRYIDRTRAYYQALGYGAPYRWASFDDVPFTPMRAPLSQATIGVVTTAAPVKPEAGDQGPGAPYNAAAKFYEVYALPANPVPDLRISHVAIDSDHTSAEDPGSFLPLPALEALTAEGRIGRAAPRVFGLPTNRSHRHSTDIDAPRLIELACEDGLDGVVLVANCPVCHQSVSLAARALEAAGVSTVIMGCARDIVETCGVPRFLFSDFPLGNGAGRPHDPASQRQSLEMALGLLETATGPRTTKQSLLKWQGAPDWKLDYCNVERISTDEIAHRRAAFDTGKETARRLREG